MRILGSSLNIVQLLGVYETHSDVLMVQELCHGGPLLSRLTPQALEGAGSDYREAPSHTLSTSTPFAQRSYVLSTIA